MMLKTQPRGQSCRARPAAPAARPRAPPLPLRCRAPPRAAGAGPPGGSGGDRAPAAGVDAAPAAGAPAAVGLQATAPAAAAPWKWEDSDDALVAYGTLAAILAVGTLPALHSKAWAGARAPRAQRWAAPRLGPPRAAEHRRRGSPTALPPPPPASPLPPPDTPAPQKPDLPYFIGLAVTTLYIGAHRAVTANMRQQISFKEVRRARLDPRALTGRALTGRALTGRALTGALWRARFDRPAR
jgi:hypothetical protein